MTRRALIGLAAASALAGLAVWLFLRPAAPAAGVAGASAHPRPAVIVPGVWPARSPAAIMAATPPDILHYADRLDSRDETAADDVQLLVSLLQLFRRVTQGLNPVGDNAEITAVLTGKNKLGYAFIRPNHPAIDAGGELCDRWGTPYYFHQISGTAMQVRSAGPDRVQWTGDDVVAGL